MDNNCLVWWKSAEYDMAFDIFRSRKIWFGCAIFNRRTNYTSSTKGMDPPGNRDGRKPNLDGCVILLFFYCFVWISKCLLRSHFLLSRFYLRVFSILICAIWLLRMEFITQGHCVMARLGFPLASSWFWHWVSCLCHSMRSDFVCHLWWTESETRGARIHNINKEMKSKKWITNYDKLLEPHPHRSPSDE